MYITICKTASGSSLYDAGSSNPVLGDNLGGGMGLGVGIEVPDGGDTCVPVADACLPMA